MLRAIPLLHVVTLLVATLLAGCGFHLRGQGDVPPAFAAVAVRDSSPAGGAPAWYGGTRDDLARSVIAAFRGAGIAVRDDATVIVDLLGETSTRRVASIDANASAAEYQVDYALRYRVTGSDGAILVPETTLIGDGSYRNDENAVMGSAEEEALIQAELRRDAATQIVRQYRRRIAALPAPAPTIAAPAADAPAP